MKKLQKITHCYILLGLLSIVYASAQDFNGKTSNIYDLNCENVFKFHNIKKAKENIGIKTTPLHVGGYHDAMVIVDMYAADLPGTQFDNPPYLYGFRTVNEPPLPDYNNDYQNVSYQKVSREIPCMFRDENKCDFNEKDEKYETNDWKIFQRMIWALVRMIYYQSFQVDYPTFKNVKDIALKVHVVIEKQNLFPGFIKSIRLPGLDEISDFSDFVNKRELNVYPNPSTDGKFTVSFDLNQDQDSKVIYELRDSFGAIVQQKTLENIIPGTNTFTIDPIGQWGTFYLKIYTPNATLQETLYIYDFWY